jgi:hypothetical protein
MQANEKEKKKKKKKKKKTKRKNVYPDAAAFRRSDCENLHHIRNPYNIATCPVDPQSKGVRFESDNATQSSDCCCKATHWLLNPAVV